MQLGDRVKSLRYNIEGVIQDIGPCAHQQGTCTETELTLDPSGKGAIRFYYHASDFEVVDNNSSELDGGDRYMSTPVGYNVEVEVVVRVCTNDDQLLAEFKTASFGIADTYSRPLHEAANAAIKDAVAKTDLLTYAVVETLV